MKNEDKILTQEALVNYFSFWVFEEKKIVFEACVENHKNLCGFEGTCSVFRGHSVCNMLAVRILKAI